MVLRGQGDSPVRICDPCKKLEEAARYELRYGHKNRARGLFSFCLSFLSVMCSVRNYNLVLYLIVFEIYQNNVNYDLVYIFTL
jgi:hypothetical protein